MRDAARPAGATAPAPLPREVVDSAVDWLVQRWSGSFGEAQQAQWLAWRAAHPLHERAWQQVEATDARLRGHGALHGALPGALAVAMLARSRPDRPDRRRALRGAAGLAALGVAAWAGQRQLPWQVWSADARTIKGEQRQMLLPDGTRLLLNTDTAIDLHYGDSLRRVQLLQGELLITTAADPLEPARPFVVDTPAGRVRALGTRFTVCHGDGVADTAYTADAATHVAVFEGAVQIQGHAGATLRVDAGRRARFTPQAARETGPAGALPGWEAGVLVASDMRLDAFVAELRRYRPGVITLSPEVAQLRLSGVFPLRDTDRILQSLVQVLPVQVRVPVRYWVRIGPAGTASAQG